MKRFVAALALAACFGSPAFGAPVTYVYSNSFESFDEVVPDDVSGLTMKLTFDQPLLANREFFFSANWQDDEISLLRFQFTDGFAVYVNDFDNQCTYGEEDCGLHVIRLQTDGAGEIVEWYVEGFMAAGDTNNGNEYMRSDEDRDNLDRSYYCFDARVPPRFPCPLEGPELRLTGEALGPADGVWTMVPIPAAAWLFGSALGLLGWMRRR